MHRVQAAYDEALAWPGLLGGVGGGGGEPMYGGISIIQNYCGGRGCTYAHVPDTQRTVPKGLTSVLGTATLSHLVSMYLCII